MERQFQIIERRTYALTFEEVRRAIHAWLEDKHDLVVPLGVDLALGEEGAVLVWDELGDAS